ncbi:hypothetical protein HP550_10400 [Cellulomonas humilata]|uniref:Ricin B lectin domain-containing protein n=1 Tax=Cellulomonas humilata TaxID=144055 RepID=A0A7Y6A0X4_9CELL|nr:hypothetical protein [Cellulomonas humilata]NUU17656.1 hypothetical protein [Cellulomonas humilata]
MRARTTDRTTFAAAVRRATRPAASPGTDEGIAMLTVIMLMMVMGALSVLLLGVVMAQVKPTMFAGKNARTVFAAETGVDAAMSQVRSALGAPDAVSGQIYGDPTKLPCTVQGKVNGSTATLSYEVTMMYFGEDPAGKDATWRTNNQLTCTPGLGVPVAPSFALLTAEGLDGGVRGLATTAGDRTLETVYTFQVTNNNINGGSIYALGLKHCLQATGQAIGSTVVYVDSAQCGADDPRQLWTYGTDYGIHLAVTDLGATPLCMTGNASTGGNINVTLTKCTVGNTAQMFSWQGGAKWEGQKTDNSNYSGMCISAGAVYTDAELIGKTLKYGTCLGNDVTYGSFDPDARVGPGAASKATNQIVNFLEFGRCMDVTGEKVIELFMISYPCKQDPSGGTKLNWNHKWSYNEPTSLLGSLGNQQITVLNKNGDSSKGVYNATYCLKTPSETASPAYVTFVTPCSGGLSEKWTRNAEMATYGDSWTFTDRYGRCISLGDKFNGSWSKLVVAACNGGIEQKWNAPEVNQDAKLSDYKELNN